MNLNLNGLNVYKIEGKAMIWNRYNYPIHTFQSETSKGKKHKHEITINPFSTRI